MWFFVSVMVFVLFTVGIKDIYFLIPNIFYCPLKYNIVCFTFAQLLILKVCKSHFSSFCFVLKALHLVEEAWN